MSGPAEERTCAFQCWSVHDQSCHIEDIAAEWAVISVCLHSDLTNVTKLLPGLPRCAATAGIRFNLAYLRRLTPSAAMASNISPTSAMSRATASARFTPLVLCLNTKRPNPLAPLIVCAQSARPVQTAGVGHTSIFGWAALLTGALHTCPTGPNMLTLDRQWW